MKEVTFKTKYLLNIFCTTVIIFPFYFKFSLNYQEQYCLHKNLPFLYCKWKLTNHTDPLWQIWRNNCFDGKTCNFESNIGGFNSEDLKKTKKLIKAKFFSKAKFEGQRQTNPNHWKNHKIWNFWPLAFKFGLWKKIWPLIIFLVFLRSTELKSLMSESNLHVFPLKQLFLQICHFRSVCVCSLWFDEFHFNLTK